MTRFNKAHVRKSAFTQVRDAEHGGHPEPKSPRFGNCSLDKFLRNFSIVFHFHEERVSWQAAQF